MNVHRAMQRRSMAGTTLLPSRSLDLDADGRPLHLILLNLIVADACQINRKIISAACNLLKTNSINV